MLTTCLRLFVLSYSPTAPHIRTSSSVSIVEQHARLAEYQTITVDPRHRCLAVHAYAGLLRIVSLAQTPRARRGSKAGARADAIAVDLARGYSIRLPTLNITCLAFLPTPASADADAPPAIACLSADHLGRRVLDSYLLDLAEKELVPGPMATLVLDDPGSEIFIPVGSSDDEGGLEGVLVVGEESVRWVPVAAAADGGSKGKGKAGMQSRISCQLPVGLVQACAHFPF